MVTINWPSPSFFVPFVLFVVEEPLCRRRRHRIEPDDGSCRELEPEVEGPAGPFCQTLKPRSTRSRWFLHARENAGWNRRWTLMNADDGGFSIGGSEFAGWVLDPGGYLPTSWNSRFWRRGWVTPNRCLGFARKNPATVLATACP